MKTNLIQSPQFSVMVNAVEAEMTRTLFLSSGMTFLDAADYVIQAQGYFAYSILEHPEWSSIQIEIGDTMIGTIQLIEITR